MPEPAVLTTGGGLHTYGVMGCAGLVEDGDPVTVAVTLTLSPEQAITSP